MFHTVKSNHFQGLFEATPLCAPMPLCQNGICLTRGVSVGARRGVQGRSLKKAWKMIAVNCMKYESGNLVDS